jgi:hypothetical protein
MTPEAEPNDPREITKTAVCMMFEMFADPQRLGQFISMNGAQDPTIAFEVICHGATALEAEVGKIGGWNQWTHLRHLERRAACGRLSQTLMVLGKTSPENMKKLAQVALG